MFDCSCLFPWTSQVVVYDERPGGREKENRLRLDGSKTWSCRPSYSDPTRLFLIYTVNICTYLPDPLDGVTSLLFTTSLLRWIILHRYWEFFNLPFKDYVSSLRQPALTPLILFHVLLLNHFCQSMYCYYSSRLHILTY